MRDDTTANPPRQQPTPETAPEGMARESMSVVGIGVSAGGLEAVSELLRNLPSDTGLGFVFVAHPDPAHESALTDILAKVCKLPVSEARDGESIDLNHVYVIPPNTDMVISRDTLRLTPRREQRGPQMIEIETLKRKEQEIVAARNYAVNIVETLREPLLVLDASLRVRSANRPFYEMYQLAPDKVQGHLLHTMANGQWDIPSLRSKLEAIRDLGSEFQDFEVEHEFPGMGRRALVLNARRVRQSEQPESELILLAIEDVTAKQQAEESQRKSDLHIRAIVENAAEGIITIDERGIIQSFNRAAARMFRFEAAEVIGQNFKLLLPPPYRAEYDRILANDQANGVNKMIGTGREVVGRRKNDTTFPMLLAISEILEGNQRTFTALVRDISDLRAAQDRALQAERLAAIGEAMTGLTHESRNALQRMQSCLEMLAFRVGGNAEATDLIARLQAAQDELHQLYEEVRQYAAPVASRLDPCNVLDVLHVAWNDTSATHASRVAHLDEEVSASNLICVANRFALQQVFRNILENSFTACADPVEINVRCSDDEFDGRSALRIALRDNGPGFTAEQADRVFEPFYTTRTKGTGLGMAIVKRIVAVHGGKVEVGSTPGAGAEIIVTLPRTKQ